MTEHTDRVALAEWRAIPVAPSHVTSEPTGIDLGLPCSCEREPMVVACPCRCHVPAPRATDSATRPPTSVVESQVIETETGPEARRATERTETGGA